MMYTYTHTRNEIIPTKGNFNPVIIKYVHTHLPNDFVAEIHGTIGIMSRSVLLIDKPNKMAFPFVNLKSFVMLTELRIII